VATDERERDEDFRDENAWKEAELARTGDDTITSADGGPHDPEAELAAEGLTTTPAEDAAYREHVERGAHQAGEGAPTF
jgi:hypothetical protein